MDNKNLNDFKNNILEMSKREWLEKIRVKSRNFKL